MLETVFYFTQAVYVMPSTSGRAATYPKRTDKLRFFNELKELRDKLREKRQQSSIQPEETSSTGEQSTTDLT